MLERIGETMSRMATMRMGRSSNMSGSAFCLIAGSTSTLWLALPTTTRSVTAACLLQPQSVRLGTFASYPRAASRAAHMSEQSPAKDSPAQVSAKTVYRALQLLALVGILSIVTLAGPDYT